MGKPGPCDHGFFFPEDTASRTCMGPLSRQNQWRERHEPGSLGSKHPAQSLFGRLPVLQPLPSRRTVLLSQQFSLLSCMLYSSSFLGNEQTPRWSMTPGNLSSWTGEDLYSRLHTRSKATGKGSEPALWKPLLRGNTPFLTSKVNYHEG